MVISFDTFEDNALEPDVAVATDLPISSKMSSSQAIFHDMLMSSASRRCFLKEDQSMVTNYVVL